VVSFPYCRAPDLRCAWRDYDLSDGRPICAAALPARSMRCRPGLPCGGSARWRPLSWRGTPSVAFRENRAHMTDFAVPGARLSAGPDCGMVPARIDHAVNVPPCWAGDRTTNPPPRRTTSFRGSEWWQVDGVTAVAGRDAALGDGRRRFTRFVIRCHSHSGLSGHREGGAPAAGFEPDIHTHLSTGTRTCDGRSRSACLRCSRTGPRFSLRDNTVPERD